MRPIRGHAACRMASTVMVRRRNWSLRRRRARVDDGGNEGGESCAVHHPTEPPSAKDSGASPDRTAAAALACGLPPTLIGDSSSRPHPQAHVLRALLIRRERSPAPSLHISLVVIDRIVTKT